MQDELMQLCFSLDNCHLDIYRETKEKFDLPEPKCGFLNEDCYSPYGLVESYPCLEYSLNGFLEVLSVLNQFSPGDVHPYLGMFSYMLKRSTEALKIRPYKFGEEAECLNAEQKLQIAIRNGQKFLSNFAYKSTKLYRKNTAILMVASLWLCLQKSHTDEVGQLDPMFRETIKNTTYSLCDIAQKTLAATRRSARDIQYIAIGIRSDGNHLITTNYHTPVVYFLSDFLSDSSAYQSADRIRRQYKKYRNATELTFSTTIHAETMLAELKEQFDIREILVIDANGKKSQNCLYCASRLQQNGWQVNVHMDSVKNYTLPSTTQRSQVTDFLFSRLENLKNGEEKATLNLNYIGTFHNQLRLPITVQDNQLLYQTMMSWLDHETASEFILQHAEEDCFSVIRRDYPINEIEIDGLKGTYHNGIGLADVEKQTLERVSNHKGTRVVSDKKNQKVTLFGDGHIRISTDNANLLESVDPHSPRSSEIAKMANNWLLFGKNPQPIVVKGNHFILQR